MRIRTFIKFIALFTVICFQSGCRETIIPRPRGYFRIDLPVRNYLTYNTDCPFTFEYPSYANISYDVGINPEPCWMNIEFPAFKAKIYISYKSISGNLAEILKESHDFAYSHSIKADAITEMPWLNRDCRVFGTLFDIKGNTASSVQFFMTDSIKNYLRGALYFAAQPNEDSLSPVIDFLRGDILHMVETLKWK
jgi:gliding motility-associated lipoprotein GldD